MYCSKCGVQHNNNELYCSSCGNSFQTVNPNYNTTQNSMYQTNHINSNNIYQNEQVPSNNQKPNFLMNKNTKVILGIIIGLAVILLIIIALIIVNLSNPDYYINEQSYENKNVIETKEENKSKYKTSIIYDSTYEGVTIKNEKDAYNLINSDSVKQKDSCPKEIKQIENELSKKYDITAINLCEMDIEFAKEIGNVLKKLYNDFPVSRGYITNITLVNTSMNSDFIAAFMPSFQFATSDTESSYPWVIKTQILLNSKYFLNIDRLDSSVKQGSSSGHFPPNASIYSPVAHEFGHYLSFLAMMNYYDLESILIVKDNNIKTFYEVCKDFGTGDFSLKLINEAYQNYKRDTKTNLSLDQWRATISQYAVTKNSNGEYIYDETIAEAFHDVYLNDNNAKDASKYIVEVLKKKLER